MSDVKRTRPDLCAFLDGCAPLDRERGGNRITGLQEIGIIDAFLPLNSRQSLPLQERVGARLSVEATCEEMALLSFRPALEPKDEVCDVGLREDDKLFARVVHRTRGTASSKEEAVPPKKKTVPNIGDELGANKVNRDLVRLHKFLQDKLRWMYYEGMVYQYNGRYYVKMNDHECMVSLREVVECYKLDKALVPRTYRDLHQLIIHAPNIQRTTPFPPNTHLINLLDGTFNLETMRLGVHTPEDGFFSCINVSYDELSEATGENFERFIACASAGEPLVRKQVLQLILIAMTGLETKSFFVAVGPSGTGKTQLGRLIAELLGRDQVSTIRSMNDFGEKFALANIECCKAILCLDLPDEPLPSAAVGMLKQLVGDDPLCIEPKYKDPQTIYQKPVFFCAGNYPVRLNNFSREDALLKRMVVIPFVGVPKVVIPQFYQQLVRELPYIVHEAINEYYPLVENGCQPTWCEVPEEYQPQDACNTKALVEAFLTTCCIFETNAMTTTQKLYHSYRAFCDGEGEVPVAQNIFGRHLSETTRNMEIPVESVKRAEGDSRGYRGIRLKHKGDDTV